MRSKNLICASFAFLIILISAYFGATIHSSFANDPISYLNEFDHISYYDVELIPYLNFQAAIFTIPFLVAILVFELIIAFKSNIRQVKNLAYGAIVAVSIVIVVDILTLINPYAYNMSAWGYLWIAMSAIILAANMLSVFIKGNT